MSLCWFSILKTNIIMLCEFIKKLFGKKDEPLFHQMTEKEISKLIDEAGYCTPEVKSINKPKFNDSIYGCCANISKLNT